MAGRPATIDDVARESGVSVATVSRALRGLPNVAPSTRRRVQDAAERLDYRPDPAAARLATGRSQTVALAAPDLGSWYSTQVIAAAEAVLAPAGYDLLVLAVNGGSSRRRLAGGPLLKHADGLIVVDLKLSPAESASLAAAGVEVVSIGAPVDGSSTVRVDDVRVATLAVDHLIGLGHTRIGLLAGLAEDPLRFDVPVERRRGYRGALRRAGIEPDERLERSGNFSVDGGGEAMAELLQLAEAPTAVFAMSDEMAFGALRTLWARGLNAPDQLSVVGVDDHELSSVVGLTTVRQDVGEHGSVAARLLLDRLRDRSVEPTQHQVPIALIERRTSGPPPGHGSESTPDRK